jgi:hypothetical protein
MENTAFLALMQHVGKSLARPYEEGMRVVTLRGWVDQEYGDRHGLVAFITPSGRVGVTLDGDDCTTLFLSGHLREECLIERLGTLA